MSTKRKRGNSLEYIIKRKHIRAKPWTFTFPIEQEAKADAYIKWLEDSLDSGSMPKELVDNSESFVILGELIREYLVQNAVAESDKKLLNVIYARIGVTKIAAINYSWVEVWVSKMKSDLNLKPTTIRHYVGALARCLDWAVRKEISTLTNNPIRMLPKSYAQYNESDLMAAKITNEDFEDHEDESRERRLEPGEEGRIYEVMARKKLDNKERPFEMRYQAALELMFSMALETAMRMREIFTLNLDQIDIPNRTIFIYRSSKDYQTKVKKLKRKIPMTTVIIKDIQDYMEFVKNGQRGMEDFTFEAGRLFPWMTLEKDCTENQAMNKVTAKLSAQFGRIFEAAGCPDLHFHDLRHEATSRLFERTNLRPEAIRDIVGHSSNRTLARYTHLRPSEVAEQLW